MEFMIDSQPKESTDEKQKAILSIVNYLLGSYIRIREIHWNTRLQATHNLTSSIMPDIIDYSDALLELMMGFNPRPGFDILKPVIPSTKNLKEIIQALVMKVETSQEFIQDPRYRGINKTLDDLIADLNKWSYLSDNS